MLALRATDFLLIVMTAVIIDLGSSCAAADPVSHAMSQSIAEDQRIDTASAIAAIFADDHVAESALLIHQRAAAMTPGERFEFLNRWVLPNESHATIRIQVGFTTTHPAPPVTNASENSPQSADRRRLNSGGRMVSPALDLVDAAVEVSKLDVLLEQVERIDTANPLDAKNRIAMLAILSLKRDNINEALRWLDMFLPLSTMEQPDNMNHRAAEVILFESGRQFPVVCEALGVSFNRIIQAQRKGNVWTIWERQFKTVRAFPIRRERWQIDSEASHGEDAASQRISELPGGSTSSGQWASVSTATAETRGNGIPPSEWQFSEGQATNIVSHGDDYLYFNTPMRGNFQIECDLNSFGWTDTELMVCGTWVSPVYTHLAVDVGDVRDIYRRQPLSPRMTKIADRLHYRTQVQNNVATTYVNGRLLHTQQLSEDHDPWIAIRNDYKNEGSAFNVRVTGQPEFPDSIRITASPMLEGWVPYFGGSVGWSDSHWQGLYRGERGANPGDDIKRGGGILGSQETNGRDCEEALFYHRPLLEDGTIEYEFFYRQDAVTAHPAIDRLCFLFEPSGVQTHWLSDGIYDRTELSPDNAATEPNNRRGPKSLPLMDNAWNHMSLKLTGDTVELTLNGQLVYQRTLESTNQRRFGFFHYADRSELRVRNVVWKGDWPRSLPSLTDQELATDEAGFLDRNTEHLTADFFQDFTTAAKLNEERFSVIQGIPQDDLKATRDGLLAIRSGDNGYRNTTIAPNLQVDGDFDVTVAYDNYESMPTISGSSSLMLIAMLDNASSDEFFVTRRHIQDTEETARQIVQCVTVQKRTEGEGRDYFVTMPMEERSGRLRLARRGNQIYYLSAEGDSPNFQLRGSRQISRDSIKSEGIRLVNQMYRPGSSSVIWKSLSVRAEKLAGSAVGETNPKLEALNNQREKLATKVAFDFTKASPDPVVFYRWSDVRPWDSEHAGLRIQADGSDTWQSAGISTRHPITGDFDITMEFDVVSLDIPRDGDETSVILQVDMLDQNRPQLNNLFCLSPSGQKEVFGQIRQKTANGETSYRRIETIQVASVEALRMARRGTRWTMLARMKNAGQDRIVAEIEVSDRPVLATRLLLHTGGANRRSEILLKKIHIHADEYLPP